MRALFRTQLLLSLLPVISAAGQSQSPVAILPDTVAWVAVSHTPGAHVRWLVGQGQPSGAYAFQTKFERGTRGAPHTHPDIRFTVVLSGTWYVGFGDTFDESKLVAIPAGSLYVAPAGVPHFMWAKDGEVVIQEAGSHPTATDFVKPRPGQRP